MMCKKLIYLISFVVVLSLAGDVQAAIVKWTDTTGDHNWFTAGNWDSLTVPTSADHPRIKLLPGPTIANEGAVTFRVWVGDASQTGALTVDGGTLTVADRFTLAPGAGTKGTLRAYPNKP